jgi:hypothetical protein
MVSEQNRKYARIISLVWDKVLLNLSTETVLGNIKSYNEGFLLNSYAF